MRIFAEESAAIRQRLLDLPALKTPSGWNSRMLDMLRNLDRVVPEPAEVEEQPPRARPPYSGNDALAEPLSQREREVLELINEGLANKEIAARMTVAPATVKAHIRNLYGKLDVSRRTEALARARELGLLD